VAAALIVTLLASERMFGGEGGSGYSRYGIGDIRYYIGARSAGMGGTALAILTPGTINWLNPAGETKIDRTLFTGTFAYEGFKSTDGIQSVYLSSGNFGGALLVIPISSNDGVVFTGGFNPYSTVNYRIQLEGSLASHAYTQLYSGEGGLSSGQLGLSLRPLDSVHVGLRFNYLFGQIRRSAQVNFQSADLNSVTYRRTVSVTGFVPTLGVIYTGLGQLTGVQGLRTVNIGAVFSPVSNLDATEERINAGSAGEDTTARRGGKLRIPFSAGVGLSWLVNGQYLLAGDLFFQNWKNLRYLGEAQTEIRNSTRLALGFERVPSADPRDSYWQKVAYRLGASYLSSYYQIGATSINEIGGSAGLGLPIGPDSRLDLAIEYARRGTTDRQLLRDHIIRFSVTLTAGERWFIRIEED